MDRDGTFINPHQIFSILLWHLAGTRNLEGAVAKTFSTTKMIDKIAAKFGRKVWETPIGFKYICDRMLESDILLGGEESGGIGTKLHLPERDATVNALLLAEVMAWHGKSLGELVALLHRRIRRTPLRPRGSAREKRAERKSDRPFFVRRKSSACSIGPSPAAKISTASKLYLGDIGWVMVRASGTEHMLRIYSETTRPETTKRVLDYVVALVQKL